MTLGPTTSQARALTQVAAALRELAERRLAALPLLGATPQAAPASGGRVPYLDQASAAAAAWAIAATEPAAYKETEPERWDGHVAHMLRKAQYHDREGTNGMGYLQEFFSRKLASHDTILANLNPAGLTVDQRQPAEHTADGAGRAANSDKTRAPLRLL